MSSLKLNQFDADFPFDLAIKDGSFDFSDNTTDKATMALSLVKVPIIDDLGNDTSVLGGELLMDNSFCTAIEDFVNTSLTDNIDNLKNEVEKAMAYVGVALQDINVTNENNQIKVSITPVNGDTFNINF